MQIETLIHARWVIPVEPAGQVLEHHAVAVSNGRIAALLPSRDAERQIEAKQIVRLADHALIPGLVNAHTHAAMTLFRGLADDMPLMTWLNDHIWPAEARWVHEDFVAAGTELAVAEMIMGGTTCFNDMYFFPDVTGRVAANAGMRAVVGLIVIDFPSAWATDADDYLAKAIDIHDRFRSHPLISTAFAPHAPYSVSDQPLRRLSTLANELDIPVHMHVHETRDEIEQGLAQHGNRPMERIDALGLLNPSLVGVHLSQLDEADIGRFAASGAHAVHCPESNLKLASGFCPVAKLVAAGVNVALGTDGAASNNDLDMLGEMRSAALLAKGVAADPSVVSADDALRMATLNGARALGLATEIGSIEVGKSADLAAIDLGRLQTQPVYQPVSQIVYAAGRDQVTDVWIRGQRLLQDGGLTTIDLPPLLQRAAAWADRIAG